VKYSAAVVDTNVVVAGLLTSDPGSPTVRILDAMRRGGFPFLLSPLLLAEYRQVLLRPKIRSHHGLGERDIDLLLTEIATHAIVREPEARDGAPDAKDNHPWSLLASQPESVLVTGDRPLHRSPPPKCAVLARGDFAASI